MQLTDSEPTGSRIRALLPLDLASNPAIAGRKAATLAALRARGFAIPDGWVIPASQVPGLVHTERSAELLGLLSDIPDVPVAVRSSGISEDGHDSSFAGQFASILNVSGHHDILSAIHTVAASSSSPSVDQYRAERGIETADQPALAVLIQVMLRPQIAGVAFSANPVSGDREQVVINAVHGLGDQLMAGAADAETWIVQNSDTRHDGARPALMTGQQARRIAALARRIEAELGAPQDIEWAIEGDRLYVLQSRPITALPVKPDFPEPPPGTWNKETAHFTGNVSVALSSIYVPEFRTATEAMFHGLGALVERLQLIDRGGELYIQAVPLGERHGNPPPGWLLGVLARIEPGMRRRVRQCRDAFEGGVVQKAVENWESSWRDDLRSTGRQLVSVDLKALDDQGLMEHAHQVRQLCGRGIWTHFQLSMPTVFGAWDLVSICREFFGWTDREALMLIAQSATASSAPATALDALAIKASYRPDLVDLIENPNVTLEDLRNVDPEFAANIDRYREEYGHRTLDNEISKPTLYERVDLIIDLLREKLRSDAISDSTKALQDDQRKQAEALLRMRSDADRRRFHDTLEHAARTNAIREEKVLYTMYLPGACMRYTLLEIGRRLAEREIISRADDIFFCTFDESVALLEGKNKGNTLQIIQARRAERHWVAANPGPAMFGPGSPMPDPSWLPEPARYLTEATAWFLGGKSPSKNETPANVISGLGASAGRYRGPVRLIQTQADFSKLRPGDVIVCSVTTSAWGVLFGIAGALVTDHGGVLSHPAIAAREHGLPAVTATGTASSVLQDGEIVIVDGSAGTVEIIQG